MPSSRPWRSSEWKWVVFDVDGVLIDVSESYDLATKLTAEHFLRLMGKNIAVDVEWLRKLRRRGGFGDDFKLSEALVILTLAGEREIDEGTSIEDLRERYGVALEEREVERVFNELYLGRLWRREKPILKTELLRELEKRFKVGVVTGRSREEMALAEKIIGYRFENVVTRELHLKPDPRALWYLVRGENGVYIGDTANDERLVENYRRKYGEFDFIMVGRDVDDVNEAIKVILEELK